MKFCYPLIVSVSLLALVQGDEKAKQVLSLDAPKAPTLPISKKPKEKKEGWIGVSVRKGDAALYAQLIGVPKGVGFTLAELEPEGPAAKAGLQSYDFVWKLDDQLLINEGQFVTLLGHYEVGDTIALTYQRRGEDHVARVVLEERPQETKGRSQAVARNGLPFFPGMPMREVSVRERFAVHEDDQGVVRVQRSAEHFSWVSLSPEGKILGRGRLGLPDGRGYLEFPEDFDPDLKNKLSALVRAYEHAAGRNAGLVRKPRVRRVPPSPSEKE